MSGKRAVLYACPREHWSTCYELLTPYEAAFVEEMRWFVPRARFIYEQRVYHIQPEVLGEVAHLARAYFDLADVTSDVPSDYAGADLAAFRTLNVVPGAPMAVVSAAYRALAKLYHPDAGGSHERMIEVNNAYARIEELAEWTRHYESSN